MKKIYISIFSAFLAAMLLFLPLSAFAEPSDGTEGIPLDKAKAYYIGPLDTNKALKSSDLNEKIDPSSTVKLMSGLLLCEYYADKLDDKISVSTELAATITAFNGKKIGITKKYNPSVRDLLYAGFCGGYGDAILVLVYNAYGSEPEFTAVMNQRAASLGMNDTLYSNATGVYNPSMYTTLYDLRILVREAYKQKLFLTITSAVSYSCDTFPNPFPFVNANLMILTSGSYRNQLCRGLNAGNTKSGYNLVTVAEKNGIPYICIVMGAEGEETETIYSYVIANKLISWAYERYGTKTLIDTSLVVCEIPVTLSVKTESVVVVPAESVSSFVPLSYSLGKEVTYDYELNCETLEAPVSAGQKVGRMTVYCDGNAIATVELITKTAAEKSDILEGIEKIKAFSSSDFFIGTLITAVVLSLIYIVVMAFIRGCEKKKNSLK